MTSICFVTNDSERNPGNAFRSLALPVSAGVNSDPFRDWSHVQYIHIYKPEVSNVIRAGHPTDWSVNNVRCTCTVALSILKNT